MYFRINSDGYPEYLIFDYFLAIYPGSRDNPWDFLTDKFAKSLGYPRVPQGVLSPGSNPGEIKIHGVHFQNICSSRTIL